MGYKNLTGELPCVDGTNSGMEIENFSENKTGKIFISNTIDNKNIKRKLKDYCLSFMHLFAKSLCRCGHLCNENSHMQNPTNIDT